jgi:hypothetical protein
VARSRGQGKRATIEANLRAHTKKLPLDFRPAAGRKQSNQMENQDTPRQPEPSTNQRFNRCSYQLRDLPLGLFRMASDGRKWQQSARSRYRLLSTLARYAHPDGTFAASKNKSYLPKAKNLLRKENIAAKTYYRLTADLRELGWLSWIRAKNHYGQRLYTIHFQQEKHLSYSAQESRIRQVITPVTTTGDSRKTPVTTTGDNTCHIRSQSHEKTGDGESDQYSHPPFDDLPPSKNSKTGSVRGGVSINHHHRLNTDLDEKADDDTREKIPPLSPFVTRDKIAELKASAFVKFQEKYPGRYREDVVLWILDTIEARIRGNGIEVSSFRYLVKGMENEFKSLEKANALVGQNSERRDQSSTTNASAIVEEKKVPPVKSPLPSWWPETTFDAVELIYLTAPDRWSPNCETDERVRKRIARQVARYRNGTGEFRKSEKRKEFESLLEQGAKRKAYNASQRAKRAVRKEKRIRERQARNAASVASEHPTQAAPIVLVNGEEKLRMLRAGTSSEEQAQHWSEISGIPARIFLVRDQFERRDAYVEWRNGSAPVT